MIIVAVGSLAGTILAGHKPLKGLDLSGGLSVVLQPQGTANSQVLNTAVSIIERRVNGLGVSNAQVEVQGHTVVISLPNIKDPQAALNELGSTAQLFFRPVYCTIPAYVAPTSSTTTTTPKSTTTLTPRASTGSTTVPATTPKAAGGQPDARLASVDLTAAGSATTTTPPTTTATPPTTAAATGSTTTTVPPSTVSQATCSASNAAQLPSTPSSQDVQGNSVILPVDVKAFGTSSLRYVLGPADMTGSIVSDASAQIDTTTGQYSVSLSLTSKGATSFDNIASSRYTCYKEDTTNPPFCSLEAFELDGLVESAPTFQTSTFNGQVSITGSFTSGQASNLANQLKYGSLPVKFVPQSTETVSATIGKDSLRAGILAGLGGIIIVMLYMILYYRALGLVVLVGLCVGAAILYSIIAQLGQGTHPYTLTLAGITGIIVSIGITVDSYVVYFERLKDEVRAGRSVRQSVERSFSRAFRTVLTADLVSFMAALILYLLTIGDVRGFAFT
ncbi:MAG TPA: protein translocase subunit SecD, partial [Acidimicrobiales bacterium]|nr:protein translocase subunit SecD [Acidimicrobiales bacterium]